MSSAKAVYPKNPLSAFGGRFEVHRKLPKLDPSLKKKTFVILTKLSSSELSKREDKNTEIENTTSFKCKQKERKIFSQNSSLYFSIVTDIEMKMEENFII